MLTATHKNRNTKVHKQTFNVPPAEIVAGLRAHQAETRQQSTSGDAYVASYYREVGGKLCSTGLFRGYFPLRDGKKGSPEHAETAAYRDRLHNRLFDYMDKSAKDASFFLNENNKTRKYSEGRVCTLFARCKNGFVGVTWFEQSGNVESAYKMCIFHMNLLGRINDSDEEFGESSQALLSEDGKKYADSLFEIKTWDWQEEIRQVVIN